MIELFENILHIALISASWLLLGLVAAGLIHAWLPMKLVGRALGGSSAGSVFRAALVGAPLPLCSCGTLPAAFSLRRSGASPASTTSFLIATPETGVDSVALSWVLLGPFMALLRPVAAILSAVSAGLLVGRMGSKEVQQEKALPVMDATQEQPSCDPASCCCSDQEQPQEQKQGVWKRSFAGLNYAFSTLLDDLALWLAIGILAAAAVITLLPPDLLSNWGSGPLAMLLILLISVPMYVCATASTPLAHAMLYAGVSPGTVLVFLLAGPASNLASIALVRKELGGRALMAYLVGVAGVSVVLGVVLDFTVGYFEFDILAGMAAAGGEDGEAPTLIAWLSLAILLVTGIRPLRRFLVRGKGGEEGGCCG
jgi:uncharacterized membrane protein YraQ (UPF0718 family)